MQTVRLGEMFNEQVITVWKHQDTKHVKHETKTAPHQPFGLFLGMSTCEIGHTPSCRNESDIREWKNTCIHAQNIGLPTFRQVPVMKQFASQHKSPSEI